MWTHTIIESLSNTILTPFDQDRIKVITQSLIRVADGNYDGDMSFERVIEIDNFCENMLTHSDVDCVVHDFGDGTFTVIIRECNQIHCVVKFNYNQPTNDLLTLDQIKF